MVELLDEFGLRPPASRLGGDRATGSAFFVSPEGRALTNHHVVAGASIVILVMSDQRRYIADVVGSDPRTDLAVLQVRAEPPLPYLTLGDSDQVRVGQIVLAVGSPFDFASTATMGIVSYIGRRGLDRREIQDYLQTDVAMNPGNSGGPLLSLRGEVVGINTAIYSKGSEGGSGISFAIPSNMAARISSDILRGRRVRRPRIGIQTEDVEEVDGDPSRRGAVVTWVMPGSPAVDAGLRRGDVIVAAQGEAVAGAYALRGLVRARSVGSTVNLQVIRGQSAREIVVELADERTLVTGGAVELPDDVLRWAGLSLTDGPAALRQQLGVGPGEGVLVARVERDSVGAAMGIVAGDRVVSVATRPVQSLAELRDYLEVVGPGPVVVGVGRGGDLRRTVLVGSP